jgi:iron complex outermembrane recepter protein
MAINLGRLSIRLMVTIAIAIGSIISETLPGKTAPTQSSSSIAQADTTAVSIIGVKIEQTGAGLDLVLETAAGKPLAVNPSEFRTEGAVAIAELANVKLSLPTRGEFRADNPTSDIAAIQLRQEGDRVRIAIVGKDKLPQTAVTLKAGNLTYSINPKSQQAEPELEINVIGTLKSQRGYRIDTSGTATKVETPLRDIPQAIQVIPKEVLRDRNVNRFDEALSNVSGVNYAGTNTTSEVRFNIRGFDDAPVLIDGFRQFGFPEFPVPGLLERVEVLKGPASILYGDIQPGGVINAVTKRPLDRPFYQTEIQLGSRNFLQSHFDLSGPIDKRSAYRLNTVFSTENDFRPYDGKIQNIAVAPVFSWRVGDRTNISVDVQYQQRDKPYNSNNSVAIGRSIANVPQSRTLSEPDDYSSRKFFNVGYNVEHRFDDNWAIRNGFRYTDNFYLADLLTIPLAFNPATGVLTRVFASDDFHSTDYALQTSLEGKFNTGSVKHALIFGVDYGRNTTETFFTGGAVSTLNLFDPIYRSVPRPPNTRVSIDRTAISDRLGIYLQDRVAVADNLKVLLGLRYDTLQQTTQNAVAVFTPTGGGFSQSPSALTPQVGVVYQPTPAISLYTSYATAFNPNNTAFDANGRPLGPERSRGLEIGVKTDLIPNRLAATLAYFDITKENVATPTNIPTVFVATGEQQSRGVEFDLTGEILPGWNAIVTYTHTQAQVTRDNLTPIGNRLAGVPDNSLSLWTTYTFQTGGLQGLGFGGGVNFVGNRQGDLANSFDLGAYSLVNAAIFYQKEDWRFALNFKNIFNEKYYPGTPFNRVTGITTGDPFTVVGSVSVQF